MRIANNTITRNYLTGLNRNLNLLNRYNEQVISGQRFKNFSEDPSSGVHALRTRRDLIRIDSYLQNAKMAKDQHETADGIVNQMGDICKQVNDLWIQASNGTYDSEDRATIQNQIEKLQEELLSLANGSFSQRYLFGGTNTTSQPFTVGDNGELLYNGTDVTTISAGDPVFNMASYIEIGLGINFDGTASDTQVNPSSAFNTAIVGLNLLGWGDNNVYNMMTDMLTMLNGNWDSDDAGNLLTRFQSSMNKLTSERTRIGADTQYLEFTIERLETEKVALKTRQQTIEGKESTEAIIDWTYQEYIYNAALSMGQRLIQPSLFNFIN